MADRSKAPVETITESSEPAAPEEEAEELVAEAPAAAAGPETDETPASAPEPVSEPELASEPEPVSDAAPSDEPSADELSADGTSADADSATGPVTETTPLLPAPVRHSGDRIADRYRLEECLTQAGVFTSWRAVDEKLRRAVGIHLLAAGHARSQAAVAAARQAALLGDPRFVQVLDAVEEGELVYIIREWLPDATDLGALLAEGPLEPYEAYQMARQVTDAIAAAHRKGLSHLRLTPACVLRSDGGQYRITGIALDAALHGLETEDGTEAARTDARALGTLLFAALTHRWPGPEDRYGLQGMPRAVGVVPPEQVRAGVHRGLSDLCARTLCEPPVRHLEPIASPAGLARAIDLIPKIRQPDPEPLVLPEYPTRSYPGSPARGGPPTAPPRRPGPPVQPPPPALPGRTGKALRWGISLVVLAAVGLGSWGTAQVLMDKRGTGSGNNPVTAGVGGNPKPSVSAKPSLHPLKISGAVEFSPRDKPIAGPQAPLSVDGDPGTAWMTSQYLNYAKFGNYPSRADGSGIVVDLGSVQNVSGVKLVLPVAGETLEVLAAPADATSAPLSSSSDFSQRVSNIGEVMGTTFTSDTLATPVRTRFVLIHVTSLPADPTRSGAYRGGISEIQVLG
ncbi:serine/threonine protein kinase [Streptacidiphilus sp. N1-12]|uniref:Serine/threonine protein kinase n=2 Tax=Streptacidiphilus alkalitolerans TaxID=3342712 RepID=A0ABV6WEH4_9ACTN